MLGGTKQAGFLTPKDHNEDDNNIVFDIMLLRRYQTPFCCCHSQLWRLLSTPTSRARRCCVDGVDGMKHNLVSSNIEMRALALIHGIHSRADGRTAKRTHKEQQWRLLKHQQPSEHDLPRLMTSLNAQDSNGNGSAVISKLEIASLQNHTASGTAHRSRQPKKEAPWPTLFHMGRLPDDPRAWQSGAVLVDKPLGWTSFDVCGKLRGALKIKKIGHAGTLDPQATGLLIVCVGRGCKRVDSFVAMEKEYSGVLRLGQSTPSFDAETAPDAEMAWEHLTDSQLSAAAATFVGNIQQLPPMFSAIKIKGQPLYLAARAGQEVHRHPRSCSVSRFHVERCEKGGRDVAFSITCSKGTYIRSLAHDLGQKMGSAAHLVALRREAIGEHNVEDAWQMSDLVSAISLQRAGLRVPPGVPISSGPVPSPAQIATNIAAAADHSANKVSDSYSRFPAVKAGDSRTLT